MLEVSGQCQFLPKLHDCLGHFLQLTALVMLHAKKVRVIQSHLIDSFPFGSITTTNHSDSPSAAPLGYWQEVGREVHSFWGMKA